MSKKQSESTMSLTSLLSKTRAVMNASKSQLAILEWAKDKPHMLDKNMLQFALQSFSDIRRLFSVFISNCER